MVAEESAAAGNVPDVGSGPFFLVDPLDGTREFIGRNGEFTVNVALIEDGVPTVGVVHLPVLDETFWTAGDGVAWRVRGDGSAGRTDQRPRRPASSPGAGRAGSAGAVTGSSGAEGDAGVAVPAGAGTTGAAERIACRTPGDGGLVVIASRSHRDPETDRYLERLEIAEIVSAGSSLKFCRIAEGAADLYPRLGPHHGMGRRGRPCHRQCGGGQRRDHRRRTTHLRQAGVRQPPLRGARPAAGARVTADAPRGRKTIPRGSATVASGNPNPICDAQALRREP